MWEPVTAVVMSENGPKTTVQQAYSGNCFALESPCLGVSDFSQSVLKFPLLWTCTKFVAIQKWSCLQRWQIECYHRMTLGFSVNLVTKVSSWTIWSVALGSRGLVLVAEPLVAEYLVAEPLVAGPFDSGALGYSGATWPGGCQCAWRWQIPGMTAESAGTCSTPSLRTLGLFSKTRISNLKHQWF